MCLQVFSDGLRPESTLAGSLSVGTPDASRCETAHRADEPGPSEQLAHTNTTHTRSHKLNVPLVPRTVSTPCLVQHVFSDPCWGWEHRGAAMCLSAPPECQPLLPNMLVKQVVSNLHFFPDWFWSFTQKTATQAGQGFSPLCSWC